MPKKIALLEQNEFALYKTFNRLTKQSNASSQHHSVEIVPVLGSTSDQDGTKRVLKTHDIDTVYHAAAYKHVDLVEKNFFEGIKNNFLGTSNFVKAAIDSQVSKFVLVSTDKAVRPTSMMGASKRLAEMCLQASSGSQVKTTFAIVRFGNVLESSGSVVPLFREQISNGGPLTLTDPEATRYFMTISEAAQLVIQAGALSEKTDEASPVYLLDMGEPVKIIDIAKQMILLSGRGIWDEKSTSPRDIKIEVVGLKSGEKLHEELLIAGDVKTTEHQKIYVAQERTLDNQSYLMMAKELERLIKANDEVGLVKELGKRFEHLKIDLMTNC